MKQIVLTYISKQDHDEEVWPFLWGNSSNLTVGLRKWESGKIFSDYCTRQQVWGSHHATNTWMNKSGWTQFFMGSFEPEQVHRRQIWHVPLVGLASRTVPVLRVYLRRPLTDFQSVSELCLVTIATMLTSFYNFIQLLQIMARLPPSDLGKVNSLYNLISGWVCHQNQPLMRPTQTKTCHCLHIPGFKDISVVMSFINNFAKAIYVKTVAGRAFHISAFSNVMLNTPHNTTDMLPRLRNVYRIHLHITSP